jgi:precorrin-6B methylase 2
VAETRYGIVQYSPRDERLAESLRYYGEYLHSHLALMGRFIRPGSWLLEIGAGIGVNALFMAECAGKDGHVIAYEADPLLHQIARQNLSANHVTNVTLLSRDVIGPARDRRRLAGPQSIVPVDTVDDLALRRIDWIRIDGTRCADILAGAQGTIWLCRPWLFVNAATDHELDACVDAMRDYGYQTRPVRAPYFAKDNYNRRSDDIFGGATALALLCVPEEIEMDVEVVGTATVAQQA